MLTIAEQEDPMPRDDTNWSGVEIRDLTGGTWHLKNHYRVAHLPFSPSGGKGSKTPYSIHQPASLGKQVPPREVISVSRG
jgi:hypothetical protein